MSDTATYMYALARSEAAPALPAVSGISDAPVRVVVDAGVSCYVSTVAVHEFGEDALRDNLEDLAWLERTARQHDRVVQACADMTTIAPLRLATICANDNSVRERLRSLSGPATAILARLDGRLEFGVKLFGTEPAHGTTQRQPADPSGTAYLQWRRDERAHQETSAEQALHDADAVYSALRERAAMARRHPPQDRRLTGDRRIMVLNAAFLIDREAVELFRAAVDQLAADRAADSLVLTGPWPPYSFATLDES